MKRISLPLPWITAALCLAATTLGLTAASLKVGDPAPELKVGKWVQGSPVSSFEKDKAYIVEFWATWCGPCRATIPHLNEIHQKFKDKGLVVIGQDVWERDESKVEPFLKEMGDKMTYRVALDDKSADKTGFMAVNWMQAAGQNGIPSAFLVNKQGLIAWIGHPMSLKDRTVEEVLAGTHDLKKAAEEAAKAKANEEVVMKLSRQLGMQMQKKQWDDVEKTIEEFKKVLPADELDQLDGVRLSVLMGKGQHDAAAKLALKMSDSAKDNAMLQNQIAWQIATTDGIKGDIIEAALTIAARGNEAAKGKDSAILDTLARVQFIAGKKEQAISTQQKAVDLAKGKTKKQLEQTLQSYKDGKLPSNDQDE